MTEREDASGCTPPPPKPPDGSSDWPHAVHGNCYSNEARLAAWTGGTTLLKRGDRPSPYFKPLSEEPLAAGLLQQPPHVYVVVHGWAPGYRQAVKQAGGKLRWWDDAAGVGGVWPSDWAWVGVSATEHPLTVNPTGLLQSIVAYDPSAIPLAYSWLDDSATDGGYDEDQVYISEAYTETNGVRLGNALRKLSILRVPLARLHLIGHSHGSKVATVAALYLQKHGLRVDGLTLLDAPESDIPLWGNGANFLPLFLAQIAIADPSNPAAGVFVDNYTSCFGVGYEGPARLVNVVETMLDPDSLYAKDDLGDQHTYAAGWYGGSGAAARKSNLPPLGLGWPPPWKPFKPALDQNWPTGINNPSQWRLAAGAPIAKVFSYSFPTLTLADYNAVGNVSGDPVKGLVFGAPAPLPASEFLGYYRNAETSREYALACDVEWSAPVDGDYLVITVESPELGEQEVAMVMDGKSIPQGRISVTLATDTSSIVRDLQFYVFYMPASGNKTGTVTVSNLRKVKVETGSSSEISA